MASLVRILAEQARRRPERLACVVGDDQRTYGELAAEVLRFACGLRRLGLKPGDRIGLYVPNSIEYVVAFYGSMRAGLIANPINSVFTPSEVQYLLADSEASAVVSTPELFAGIAGTLDQLKIAHAVTTGSGSERHLAFADLLAGGDGDLEFVDDSAAACLPYSSGTTGYPKGIIHTHDSLTAQAIQSADHLQMRPHDTIVEALPLVHLYPGNIIMGGVIVAGAGLIVQPRFDPPAFVELMGRYRVTACAGVPTTYAMLCQVPEQRVAAADLGSLEVAYSAGAPLPSRIRSEFRRLYGVRVLDCYGITEAAGNLTAMLRYGDAPELSCGLPYPRTDIRIVDLDDNDVPEGEVGELIARGPQIMSGYWNRSKDTEVTLRGGYLHTGDLARRDEDGFYFIVDRKKDMIIVGGYNVYPAELENVIQSHPAVGMCAVFGVPDEVKGEKPWAAVVPKAGATVDPADLEQHCRRSLAAYKVPRRFIVVDELPKSSVGKILRRQLRDQYAAQASDH